MRLLIAINQPFDLYNCFGGKKGLGQLSHMSISERAKVFYFCDETGHAGQEKYMAVGGIAINLKTLSAIEEKIELLRSTLNIRGEVKWSNTKARRDNGQLAYAELLRKLVKSNNLHFHVRFQATNDYNHRLSGNRKKIDTVSKAHYQLLTHRPIKFYGNMCDLHIRPDDGECTELLPSFLPHLRTESFKMYGAGNECVRSIHPTESKRSHALQLLDVTLGAFACIRNGRHLRGDLSTAKTELAHHVHRLWGNFDLESSHAGSARQFNVWNVLPSMKSAVSGA